MKWSLRRGFISALGVCLVVLIGLYFYFFEFGGLERIVIGKINSALGEDAAWDVTIGNIGGTVITGVVLDDVTVSRADSSGRLQVLHVSHVAASYAVTNLWNRQFLFETLHIDSLDLLVAMDSNGKWLIPTLPGSAQPRGRSKPMFAVDRLSIAQANIRAVRDRDTLTFDDLTLQASIGTNEDTYAVEIAHIGCRSSLTSGELVGLSGKVTYANGNIVFQDVHLTQDDTRIKLDGSLALNEGATGGVNLAIDNLDLGELCAIIGGRLRGMVDINGRIIFADGHITGQVNLGGDLLFAGFENLFVDFEYSDKKLVFDTLYGTVFGDCGVDGSGDIDFTVKPENYHLNAKVRNFNLRQLIKDSFESDMTGTVELEGWSFSNADLLLMLDVDLFESSFDEYPLQRAVGPIGITTDSLWFPDEFCVDYFENSFRTVGVIDYDDEICLDIDADLRNLDRYRGKLFIDQPGGRAHSSVIMSGKTRDPDLAGWLASDSLWLYGLFADSCFSSFSIDRFLTGREGWVEVELYDGRAWPMPYDTGYAKLHLDSQLVWIDTVGFSNKFAAFGSKARLDQGTDPWKVSIDTLSLTVLERDFYNRGPIVINVDTIGFDFDQASIGKAGSMLRVDGRTDYDESMDLSVLVENIPVASWLYLYDQDLDLNGYLSGTAEISGNFDNPIFGLTGSIDSLVYRDVYLGDLTANIEYGDTLVRIDSVQIFSHPGVYAARGSFYTDLAFAKNGSERLPNRPIDLSITAHDNRFDLVKLLLPSVEDLQGDFHADFRLSGTPSEPHLDGEASIRNGRLKYFDLVDTLLTDSAHVTMTDNRIEIEGVETYVHGERDNNAVVSGVLTVKALDTLHYDIDVALPSEFPFKYELDDIEGVAEGEVHIEGDFPPQVTGDLTLLRTRYRTEFATEGEGSPLLIALYDEDSWDLNLNIEIPSNFWIKNQDIDAEFSGFMNLIRENNKYRFIGELEILKGRGFLFDKTFRIEPGSKVIYEDIEYPDPRMDISAITRIPVVRFNEEEERSQSETLCIHIQGTLENPTFSTCEGDTLFSNEDILPLILANYYGSESMSAGRFEERVSQLVSSQVSQIGTRQLQQLGVETFEIDPTYGDELGLRGTRVTVGVYTNPNLYLYGRSAVSFDRGQEVGFEYRFNKAFLLEGRRDEDELYHMNLKLRWEL
ncbi:MAG: hypothetical protein DRP45_01715 [Candidatus Zixiibacteriota bacterium]|nr:MAG: hypothetical protein DRP45_01715 [candidate division Zixibacteria bacterium]